MIDAPSCAPRQLRNAASCAGAPAASTSSPMPRRRSALTALGHSEMPAPISRSSRCSLEDQDFAAGSLERDRGCEAADSGADHQGAIVHVSRLCGALARSRRRSSQSVGAGLGSAVCCSAERPSWLLSRASSLAPGPRAAAHWSSVASPASASRRCSGTRSSTRRAMRVLRAGGIEAESELAFAALHQLLRPVLDRVGRLAGAAGGRACRCARPVSRFRRGPLPDRRGGSRPSRGGRRGAAAASAWSTMRSGSIGRRPTRSRSRRGGSRRRAS